MKRQGLKKPGGVDDGGDGAAGGDGADAGDVGKARTKTLRDRLASKSMVAQPA